MRQRAMIAMALSCRPQLLIADEPTTALDVTIQAQILELIQSLQEKFAMTVQFITHDLGVVSEIADDVMVMYAGNTCEKTSAEKIFAEPAHPYTRALLRSIPRIGQRKKRLPVIHGTVPSPLNMGPGCLFSNRCPSAQAKCLQERPSLTSLDPDHQIACFYPIQEKL
ncbi:MAG: hypothetical protein CMP10_06285 [Zetaproteobacteria bacterium]|nr:hypothetical protein [Pseudobdellovibrionaceae bacterium]